MHYVISVDLDGTLLSSKNEVTKYTQKIFRYLMKKKFYFILASGRHYIDVISVKKILNIPCFLITSNGAKVYDLNNNLIFSEFLPPDIASFLINMTYFESDITIQVYQNNEWYINNNYINNNFLPELTCLQYKLLNLKNFNCNKLKKMFFTSKNFLKLHQLKKNIFNIYQNHINMNFSAPGCLEITSKNSSKGHGVQLIAHLLNIPLDDFFTFGNGMNDKDMLEISGHSYVMKNADICLIKKLKKFEMIQSNDEDGVAKCLYNIFIKNNKDDNIMLGA